MTEETNQTIPEVLTDMRGKLKAQFDKMVDDPVNLNNLYEHISVMTAAIDTLIQMIEPMYQIDSDVESETDED